MWFSWVFLLEDLFLELLESMVVSVASALKTESEVIVARFMVYLFLEVALFWQIGKKRVLRM